MSVYSRSMVIYITTITCCNWVLAYLVRPLYLTQITPGEIYLYILLFSTFRTVYCPASPAPRSLSDISGYIAFSVVVGYSSSALPNQSRCLFKIKQNKPRNINKAICSNFQNRNLFMKPQSIRKKKSCGSSKCATGVGERKRKEFFTIVHFFFQTLMTPSVNFYLLYVYKRSSIIFLY